MITTDIATAVRVMRFAKSHGIKVPSALSVLTLMERHEAVVAEPALTTVDVDEAMMSRLAAFLVCQEIHRKRQSYLAHPIQPIVSQPSLFIRKSTACIQTAANKTSKNQHPVHRWSDNEAERRQQVSAINHQVHPKPAGWLKGKFESLDLTRHVNRGMTPRSAWLGDEPLKHFTAGEHLIHGIPFHVVEKNEQRHSVMVLRSRKAKTSAGKPLPQQVSLPVRRKVRAIYLLMAAGWCARHEVMARIRFRHSGGQETSLDVMAYSRGPGRKRDQKKWNKESVIQDWHPSLPRFESPESLPWVITQNGDPLLYERILYNYRWENPFPDKPLQTIEMKTLLPDEQPTLAVLGVTLESAG